MPTLATSPKGTGQYVRKRIGYSATINSQTIIIDERDDTSSGNITRCHGTVTVTDAGAGFAIGCEYTKTNGTTGAIKYFNEGTASSCLFVAYQPPEGSNIADGDSFKDTNGNEIITFGVVASAVNNIKISNAATGNNVALVVVGAGDTAVSGLTVTAKAGGAATVAGGVVTVTGGLGNTTGAGGAVALRGGAGGNDAVGGSSTLEGGAAGGGNRAGGDALINGGAGAGSAAGGAITGVGGTAGATGTGGAISFTGGIGGATSGNGGAATLAGGAATASNSTGGQASVTGGAGKGTSAGGAVVLTSGASANGTAVNPGASGAITLQAGAAGTATTGTAGAGGTVSVLGATGGASTGASSTAGAGSGIVITAGNGGNSSGGGDTSGAGGSIIQTSGISGTGATAGKNGGIFRRNGDANRGTYFQSMPAPAAKTTSATLTVAEVLGGWITVNQAGGATSTQTTPTGTQLAAACPTSLAAGDCFDFHIINISTVAAEDAILAFGTDITGVGNLTVNSNDAIGTQSQGLFRFRYSGANVWVAYRIA